MKKRNIFHSLATWLQDLWTQFFCCCLQDFATRSIDLAEESLPVLHQAEDDDDDDGDDDSFDHQTDDTDGIEQFQMRRTWESRSVVCFHLSEMPKFSKYGFRTWS